LGTSLISSELPVRAGQRTRERSYIKDLKTHAQLAVVLLRARHWRNALRQNPRLCALQSRSLCMTRGVLGPGGDATHRRSGEGKPPLARHGMSRSSGRATSTVQNSSFKPLEISLGGSEAVARVRVHRELLQRAFVLSPSRALSPSHALCPPALTP
jgi:hypothetical protein